MEIFEAQSAQAVLALKWPSLDCHDKLLWLDGPQGAFSVRSCYLLNNPPREEVLPMWKLLWKMDIHERLKVFLWRVAAEALPSKDQVAKRLAGIEQDCSLCGQANETLFHLFKECHGSKAFAFA